MEHLIIVVRSQVGEDVVEEASSSKKKKGKAAKEAAAENDLEAQKPEGKKRKRNGETMEVAKKDKKPRKSRAKAPDQVDYVESRVERILSFVHQIDHENLELDYGLKDQIKENIAALVDQTDIYLNVYWKRGACGVQRKIKGKPNVDIENFSVPAKMKGTPSLKLAISVGAAVVLVACQQNKSSYH